MSSIPVSRAQARSEIKDSTCRTTKAKNCSSNTECDVLPHLIQQNNRRIFQDGSSDHHWASDLTPPPLCHTLIGHKGITFKTTVKNESVEFKERLCICTKPQYQPHHTPALTLRKLQDPAVYVSSHGGSLHLLSAGWHVAAPDVVSDGVVEEDGVLGNHANVSPQGRLMHLWVRGWKWSWAFTWESSGV